MHLQNAVYQMVLLCRQPTLRTKVNIRFWAAHPNRKCANILVVNVLFFLLFFLSLRSETRIRLGRLVLCGACGAACSAIDSAARGTATKEGMTACLGHPVACAGAASTVWGLRATSAGRWFAQHASSACRASGERIAVGCAMTNRSAHDVL